MKKVMSKLVGVVIIAILIQTNVVIGASSQKDLKNVDNKIEEKKEELNNIKEEKTDTMSQVEELTNKISSYQQQIEELDSKINDLNTQISDFQEQLNKAQEDYTKQEELLNARLVATYEAGDTSYLDFILSSESITDLISNYYLISEIATNDSELLEKIQKQKETIENTKKSLENSKNELATSKTTKQSVSSQLQSTKEQKNEQVAKLSEDEKQTQKELDQFEEDKAAIANELAEIARREAEQRKNNTIKNNTNSGKNNNSNSGNSGSNTPSAGGFIRPVSGYSITCGWYGYAGHTGADFSGAGISGKPVLAAKSGTVETSTALKYADGRYRSYGEYIVINHHDGTMTLYAHGAPGSRLVSKGQSVSQGQQIMSVGTTGNSTGYHLHFEVWLNGVRVNPANYL